MELEKKMHVSDVSEKFAGKDRYFSNFAPILEADENSIVWARYYKGATDAMIIVCTDELCSYLQMIDIKNNHPGRTYIISPNPRYTYLKIVERHAILVGITGDYKIGENAHVHPSAVIYDNVIIGDNVVIHPYCVIGSEGFGFEEHEGKLHKFPHIGRVVIGDNVEIQALTNVDRGALGDTVIGSNTKIDTQCHIGHNCKIGGGCTICAKTMTGGGTTIGDLVYIAPCVSILTRNINIGDEAFIGTGALVVKDVKLGERVKGFPAKPF